MSGMPSAAREAQVDLSATPYYHCISRCVRRAFLCGDDSYSGQNYDHRKGWFLDRLRDASEVFAIDVCAYAVMSNHFHVVLRVDCERAEALTDEAILRRYRRFFPFAARAVRELPASAKKERLAVLRARLCDISWFMRVVNEFVARKANKEDECTGRFWEGRFKSQALLDEAALYTCMSYVDLNPMRAQMSASLEDSEFTSVQQRLREAAQRVAGAPRKAKRKSNSSKARPIALAPLRGEGRTNKRPTLELRYDDYLALLRWTGSVVRAKSSGGSRRGSPATLALLRRLGIEPKAWVATMTVAGLATGATFGDEASMDAEAERRGKRWLKGKTLARALFVRAS